MKITKKTFIYVGIGVYIIIVASMGIVLFQQLGEESKVNEELTMAKANLDRANSDKFSEQQQELEEQLAQITSQCETLKTLLGQQIGNVAASSIVFDVAKSSGVEVTDLTSPSASLDIIENVACSVISLNATVEGDVPDLVDFITSLNAFLTTGVIKSVDIIIPEEGSGGTPAVSILLVIYNCQGS